jgi:hypothetical protein
LKATEHDKYENITGRLGLIEPVKENTEEIKRAHELCK